MEYKYLCYSLHTHTHIILSQHLTPLAIHARHGHELRKTYLCQVLVKLHRSVPVMNTFKLTWRSPLYNRKTILYWSFRHLSIYSTVTSHILWAKVTAVLHFYHIQFVSVSNLFISEPLIIMMLAGSAVDIATGYRLDRPGIESSWARFSAPVQTVPGVHAASCTMGSGSLPR